MSSDDAMAASKALERRARLVHLLGRSADAAAAGGGGGKAEEDSQTAGDESTTNYDDSTDTSNKINNNGPLSSLASVLVGAFPVKNHAGGGTGGAHGNNKTMAAEMKTEPSHGSSQVPSELADLERKIAVRQQGENDDSSAKKRLLLVAAGHQQRATTPGSVTQVHTTRTGQQALSAQELDLLAKSSRGGAGVEAVTISPDHASSAKNKLLPDGSRGGSVTPARATSSAGQQQQRALSAQERDLLAKSGGGGGGGTSSKSSIGSSNNNNNAAVEKATSMGILVHHMMGNFTNNSRNPAAAATTGGGTADNVRPDPQLQLQQHEANALMKQRLPREFLGSIPDNDDEKAAPGSTSGSTNTTTTTQMFHHEEPVDVALTAEIVDDSKERAKITKETQEELISNAVIATSVTDDNAAKKMRRWCGMAACGVLVLTALVLGGVCGTGNCSSGPSAAARAKAMIDFITSISLQDKSVTTQLSYPFIGAADGAERSPEQEALDHLIDDDALKLSVVSRGDPAANWRLVQRYALLVIWFTNGPWTEPTLPGEDESGVADPLASATWLVGSLECVWSGVDCDNGRVVQLSLDGRQLTGTVPKDTGLLSDLTGLRLHGNELSGSLEDTVSILMGLGGLTTLFLGLNDFNGTIPGQQLANLTSLETLSLESIGESITGSIPASIASLTGLKSLDLSFNGGLTGTIPATMAALTSLTWLGLGFGGFPTSTPAGFFDGMKDLAHLVLGISDDAIDGEPFSLRQLSGLSKLTHLNNVGPILEGSIPSEVADWWPSMNSLYCLNCNLTGTIPSSLARWTQLKKINLMSNQLTGSIPLAFFSAWSDTLEDFGVGFNNITGTFPSEIGLWSNIVLFDVGNNDMKGSLPTTIGLLSNLGQMVLNGNRFTGTIPTEVTKFPAQFANFEMNDLTGSAPYCVNQSALVLVTVECAKVSCPCCSIPSSVPPFKNIAQCEK
jgi:hypothetical protein